MSKKFYDDYIWELKYRPRRVEDIILPQKIKNQFLNILKQKQLPNLLFAGTAGIGKTTAAFCLAEELELDSLYINMSKDTSINIIRDKIVNTALVLTTFSSAFSTDIGQACHLLFFAFFYFFL